MPATWKKRNARRQRGLRGLELPPDGHRQDALVMFQYLIRKPIPNTCQSSVKILALAVKAEAAAENTRDPQLKRVALETLKRAKSNITRTCRERNSQVFELAGLSRAEMMNTRGFKDGRKSWIDVMPAGGPKMRVTHEILEGFGAISRAEKTARARAAKAKAKEEARASDPLAPTAEYSRLSSRREQYRPRYDIDSLIRFNLYAQDSARETGRFDKLSDLTRQYEKLLAKKAADLGSLEGVGSSFALMWAAAGAVALLVLSDSQKAGASSRPYAPDPAALIILQDLNRARATQGLPPLTR